MPLAGVTGGWGIPFSSSDSLSHPAVGEEGGLVLPSQAFPPLIPKKNLLMLNFYRFVLLPN